MGKLNISQLSLDIRTLHGRFEEWSSRLSHGNTTTMASAPAEPTPEVERIRRLMNETEKELKEVRDAMLVINRDIEKEWQREGGRVSSTKRIDELKERRKRCQSKEEMLEKEMRDLQLRLEREMAGINRDQEDRRRHDDEGRRHERGATSERDRRGRTKGGRQSYNVRDAHRSSTTSSDRT
ncbi:hypothetical protein GCK32_010051 [Trichostrongylus colubriformis]|uniref:Uncharacterized protein n=1 Tax=Trichostrongylus colubriformis TaxID=6319 RepID=A0AAN8ITG8_TRICO